MYIAVTGGIGSGKSEVMRILSSIGAKTIDLDKVNANLLSEPDYINKVKLLFPQAVRNQVIDKKVLASIVFSDEKSRKKLNELAQPAIFSAMKRELARIEGTVFVEVPLLAETNTNEFFDYVWVVISDKQLRISRVKNRDGRSDGVIESIINTQATDAERVAIATDIIENSGSLTLLRQRVIDLYEETIRR